MNRSRVVVGVDVALRRPCVAVALDTGRSASVVGWMEAHDDHPGEIDRLLDWIGDLSPVAVAVDAPQAPNRHLHTGSTLRVCDWEMRRRGIPLYQVPARGEVTQGWMSLGFRLFRQLRRRGLESPSSADLSAAFGQPPALLEVYPFATFRLLFLEGQRSGRVAPEQALPKKLTREGARTRIELLRRARVEWDGYYDHDSLDALAAAVTAWRYDQGLASAVGDAREGLLWLPVTSEALAELLPPRSSSAPRGG